MASAQLQGVLQHLHRLRDAQQLTATADAELLQRLADGQEPAFAVLVRPGRKTFGRTKTGRTGPFFMSAGQVRDAEGLSALAVTLTTADIPGLACRLLKIA